MKDVYIVAMNITKMGKFLDKSVKDLTKEAYLPALELSGMDKKEIGAAWFSNSGWGAMSKQISIRGQIALRPCGLDMIPITNVENACASASTAFHHAWLGVASGLYNVTLAVGVEKMYQKNKVQTNTTMIGGMDVENINHTIKTLDDFAPTEKDLENMRMHLEKYGNTEAALRVKEKLKKSKPENSFMQMLTDTKDTLITSAMLTQTLGFDTVKNLAKTFSTDKSPWMDIYGYLARKHMAKYGSTVEQLAAIASKNHYHASLNEKAQYTIPVSEEEVLADRMISWPITRSMCAPIGDGAAVAILCDADTVKKYGLEKQAVKIRASILGSGATLPRVPISERLSKIAYEKAGLGPDDIDLAEVHDATAFGELAQSEYLGFCPKGEGGLYGASGETKLGGKRPINVSGGLEGRGHPIGATGLAQIYELWLQLSGKAKGRQVEDAKIALAQNGGGALGVEEAAMCIHILEAPSL